MSDYTTKTASIKATNIDTRFIETKVLKINGEIFDTNSYKTKFVKFIVNSNGELVSTENSDETDVVTINGGICTITRQTTWTPLKIVLANTNTGGQEQLMLKNGSDDNLVWNFNLWEADDDLSLIYGGFDEANTFIIFYQEI